MKRVSIKSNIPYRFFVKEYSDGIIVAFKNIGDDNNSFYADQIHQIVSKNLGVDLFVTDIIESTNGTVHYKNIIKDSLFVYVKNGVFISACGINVLHNKDSLDVRYDLENVLSIKNKQSNKFLSVFILFIICILGYNIISDDKTDEQNLIDGHETEAQTELSIKEVKKDNDVNSNEVVIDNKEEVMPIATNDTSILIAEEVDHIENENNVSTSELVTTSNIPDDFVFIPSGTLYKYEDGYDIEHKKYIYKDIILDAFYICIHEVTQEEYERTMGSNPSQIRGSEIPVNTVQFIDAIRYCNARSVAEGYDGFYTISNNIVTINPSSNGYRLPNEYEWAYAARKDERTKTKYAGGNSIRSIAWYGGNSNCTLHPVCQKSPNGRGIYDLNGNVCEMLWKETFYNYNCCIGSHFLSYISFGESDVGGVSCSELDGFRTVLIPKAGKNSNVEDLQSVRYYIKKEYSAVAEKRIRDREDAAARERYRKIESEANEYVRIADQAYSDYADSFDESKGVDALTNYKKALDLDKKHGLFFISEREKIEQKINVLEKELKVL